MNAKGAGLTYVSEYKSDEFRTFRGGLRHLPERAEAMVHNSKNNLSNYHDKFNYERGFIQHSRSLSNQHHNFHFMYGGPKEYLFKRLFYGAWYRKNIRNFWFPAVFSYGLGCFCMRLYDNAAHDFFYFTD
ncbi:unnamed protein product (macronuclear) [Paramecium tetraurelia]|uniref:Uncharacterized protein n=1 Tax=Paramecium tetraurelia TaxID=5888 RepID=A0BB49_PARTE|nr:uncharacterized protein GSPATT00000201001 [Paramecium tetraurelia]CAK55766.1 unnamed protein product [Paramecium tetraurelia]|eukprot:XP_001423164.1 hypothetical protein (macronuclear) [Paramecium tetraurelia strain d4-2]